MAMTAQEAAIFDTEFYQRHALNAIEYAQASIKDELLGSFWTEIADSESPLEAAFSSWWKALARVEHWGVGLQHQVTLQRLQCRLDLVVRPCNPGSYAHLITNNLCPKIAIELDGHEFHERTKEQVTRRNERDRALADDGWLVLHYSGSEFHRAPEATVRDAYSVSTNKFWQVSRALTANAK